TQDHRRGLVVRLLERDPRIADAIERRQLEFVDADAVMRVLLAGDRGHVDAGRFERTITRRIDAALARRAQVAVLVEIADLMAAAGHVDALLELEDLWNQLLRDRPVSLWCACRMRALGPIDEADAAGALDAADATAPARSVRILVVDDNVD